MGFLDNSYLADPFSLFHRYTQATLISPRKDAPNAHTY